MLRERLWENCAEREIMGTLCLERICGNTLLGEGLGNTLLRERFGENFAEREIWGTLRCEKKWGNTVLRGRLEEHCAEREIGVKLC